MRAGFFAALAALAMPAMGAMLTTGPALAGEGGGGLAVQNAWLRVLIPSRPAAGYFVLRNDGDAARQLVGARSPACGGLMLHRSLQESGQDRMEMVESVEVPPHGAVRFAPGGYHLMCMSPGADVKPGGQVPVTLRFADGAALTASFAVKGASGQ